MKKIMIAGGSGFVGSNLAAKFLGLGHQITVVDGLLEKTGGDLRNLAEIASQITLYRERIEDLPNLAELCSGFDVIIDGMAWTSHLAALEDIEYDLILNQRCHAHLIKALVAGNFSGTVVYLGSRGQYGNGPEEGGEITENTAFNPRDIQSIHKTAASHYYRLFAKIYHFNVINLIFPNCIGRHQKVSGTDIGLVGGFIRTALMDGCLETFGSERVRHITAVDDLCEVVVRLLSRNPSGYHSFNFGGEAYKIDDVAKSVVHLCRSGAIVNRKLPRHVEAIDTANHKFNDTKLRDYIGQLPKTPLEVALRRTIDHFKEREHDFSL